jgi:hypothetical protein
MMGARMGGGNLIRNDTEIYDNRYD